MERGKEMDFDHVLQNIERLCCEYHRINNPYDKRLENRRSSLIADAFHQIGKVTDVDEAYLMADRLTSLLRTGSDRQVA